MKKHVETKKVIVAALILTVTLFVFPLSSFGGGGCVVRNEGNIYQLAFDFGSGLPLELPDLGEFFVSTATVYAGGRETTVVTHFGRYIYNAKLKKNWVFNPEVDSALDPLPLDGERIIYADGFVMVGDETIPVTLVFEFKSARLFEHFMIEDSNNDGDIADEIEAACAGEEVTVPQDVDLIFLVKKVTLFGLEDEQASEPFDVLIIIKDGVPIIVKVK